jgi:twinkle protein
MISPADLERSLCGVAGLHCAGDLRPRDVLGRFTAAELRAAEEALDALGVVRRRAARGDVPPPADDDTPPCGSPESTRTSDGEHLDGLDEIDPAQIVWVENEHNKRALSVAGFRSVVALPTGMGPVDPKQYAPILHCLKTDHSRLGSVVRHVLGLDADDSGFALEAELARRLGPERCVRVRWPEGCKDANDLLTKHGVEEVQWYIEHATPYPIEGAVGIDDYREEIRRLYEQGRPHGVSTGWTTLDAYYRVFPGQLTVVTGIPGSGKSNWLDCLLVNLARTHGWSIAIFSPENLPLEQHMAEMAAKYLKKPFYDGRTPRMTPVERDDALAWIADHFTWIMPKSEDDWEIERILTIAGKLCCRAAIRGLVIDPWNELESLKPSTMMETEYVAHVLKRVRVFARQRAVHVWLVVHPQKLLRDKKSKYPVPTLYDCSGSANFRNKADNGIVVWRDLDGADRDEVELHVQKIRFRYVGKRGMCRLYYNAVCATYSEQPAGGDGAARGRERFEL